MKHVQFGSSKEKLAELSEPSSPEQAAESKEQEKLREPLKRVSPQSGGLSSIVSAPASSTMRTTTITDTEAPIKTEEDEDSKLPTPEKEEVSPVYERNEIYESDSEENQDEDRLAREAPPLEKELPRSATALYHQLVTSAAERIK